ncbi:MAG: hypothetical protein J7J31_10120 [Helicobacteraceae bacterium]|nr:hypothetical protein [Helicobacteraceae bacterium]
MKILFLLLFSLLLWGKMLEVGEKVQSVYLTSQHDQKIKLTENGFWIIGWDKETTALANEYFYKHKIKKDQNMLVDVSQIPSGIFSMFVAPKMKRYSHPILLSYDEAYNLTLPYKDRYVTLLSLKDAKIEAIYFVDTLEELEKLLK